MAVEGVHAWESALGRGVASEVAPGLYLGDRETAAAPPPWRWRAVLNVTQTLADAHGASSGGLVFERIAVADTESNDYFNFELKTYAAAEANVASLIAGCAPLRRVVTE